MRLQWRKLDAVGLWSYGLQSCWPPQFFQYSCRREHLLCMFSRKNKCWCCMTNGSSGWLLPWTVSAIAGNALTRSSEIVRNVTITAPVQRAALGSSSCAGFNYMRHCESPIDLNASYLLARSWVPGPSGYHMYFLSLFFLKRMGNRAAIHYWNGHFWEAVACHLFY